MILRNALLGSIILHAGSLSCNGSIATPAICFSGATFPFLPPPIFLLLECPKGICSTSPVAWTGSHMRQVLMSRVHSPVLVLRQRQ